MKTTPEILIVTILVDSKGYVQESEQYLDNEQTEFFLDVDNPSYFLKEDFDLSESEETYSDACFDGEDIESLEIDIYIDGELKHILKKDLSEV